MMMHSNKFNKKLFIPVIFFVLLALGVFFFPQKSYEMVAMAAGSVWNGATPGEVSNLALSVKNRSEIVAENQLLSNKVEQLHVYALEHDRLVRENESLKAILHRKGTRNLLLANILSKPPITAYDTFLVDVGKADGVKKGAKVFMYGDIVIGTVSSVSANMAKVALYSTPGNILNAFLGPENVPVKLEGAGAGNFTATIPQGVAVTEGMQVFFGGEGGNTLGVVEHVEKKKSDPLQEVFVKSPVDIWSLSSVQIEIPEG